MQCTDERVLRPLYSDSYSAPARLGADLPKKRLGSKVQKFAILQLQCSLSVERKQLRRNVLLFATLEQELYPP